MTSLQRLRRVFTALLAASVGAGFAAVPAQAAAPTAGYIVSMRSTLGLGSAALDDAADRLAGDKVGTTLPGIDGFTATLTAAEAARIAADPAVDTIERDQRVRISDTQRNPRYNLDRIDQRTKTLSRGYTPLSSAGTVTAYVIDTGIRTTHAEFAGRAVNGYDFVDRDAVANDCNGHGTHVAGTIGGRTVGVAKGVKLVGVRVLDCGGEGWISDVIAGVNWVTAHSRKPAVANMSLGGGLSSSLDKAVARSIASGVTYAVAAGNENRDACKSSPARVPTALTVGATNATDTRAAFSNFGACLDLFAPGVSIYSTWKSGGYATLSGTSMASPHVAGAAAMLLAQTPSLTPAQVAYRLVAATTKNTVRNRGAKSPSRVLFTPAPPAAPAIITASLPVATFMSDYRVTLGRAPATTGVWTVSGTLPAGLTLSRAGVLSGTPAEYGSFPLTFRFTDFVPRAVTRTLTLTVNP